MGRRCLSYRLSNGRMIKKPAPKAETTTSRIVVASHKLPMSDREATLLSGRMPSGCSVNSFCLFTLLRLDLGRSRLRAFGCGTIA